MQVYLAYVHNKRMHTLVIAGGKEYSTSLIANDALSNADVVRVGRNCAAFLQHHIGIDHFDKQCMAIGSRFQALHFHEHRLPQLPWPRIRRHLIAKP